MLALVQGSRLDRVLQRLYGRRGGWYMEGLLAAYLLLVLVAGVPAITATLMPFFKATGEQYLSFVIAFEIVLAVASVAALAIVEHRHRPALRWLRGGRPPEGAAGAWQSLAPRLPMTAVLIGVTFMICMVPAAIHVAATVDLSATGLLLYLTLLVCIVAGLAGFAYLVIDVALRPVREDIAARLPAGFTEAEAAPSLSRMLLVVIPTMNLFTGPWSRCCRPTS